MLRFYYVQPKGFYIYVVIDNFTSFLRAVFHWNLHSLYPFNLPSFYDNDNKICNIYLCILMELEKRLQHRCFSRNFAKVLSTSILYNTSGWVLLQVIMPDHTSLTYTKKWAGVKKLMGRKFTHKYTSIIPRDYYSGIQLGHEVVGKIPLRKYVYN